MVSDLKTELILNWNAFNVLAPNGVVLWHDYKPSFPGVFDGLNALSSEHDIVHLYGTSIAAYRSFG